jgi:hypothetical protein
MRTCGAFVTPPISPALLFEAVLTQSLPLHTCTTPALTFTFISSTDSPTGKKWQDLCLRCAVARQLTVDILYQHSVAVPVAAAGGTLPLTLCHRQHHRKPQDISKIGSRVFMISSKLNSKKSSKPFSERTSRTHSRSLPATNVQLLPGSRQHFGNTRG